MAQVAVSVVLLVGAGLLLLSFYRLQRVDPGFRGERVMTAEVFGNFTKYPDAQSLRRLYVSMLERLESSPGVVGAAVTNGVPLAGLQPGTTRFQIQGRTYNAPEERPTADVRVASPKYFDTLNMPIRRGRALHRARSRGRAAGGDGQRDDGPAVGRPRSDRQRDLVRQRPELGHRGRRSSATSRRSASTATRSRRSIGRCARSAASPAACWCG